MKAHEIDAAAARAREAGAALRARSRDEVHGALAALFDTLRKPDGSLQRELAMRIARSAGFSETNVREGLALALAGWSGRALRAMFDRELALAAPPGDEGATVAEGFPLTALVLAGAIPMPSWLQIAAPLALHSPVLVRASSRDPSSPALFVEALERIEPELARCIELVDFDSRDEDASAAFMAAECVAVTGSDETIAAVRRQVGPAQRLVTWGHKLSIAVVDARGAGDAGVARALALDVSLWDQQGCLSPVTVHALGCDAAALGRLAERLAAALAAREQSAPRGRLAPAEAAAIAREREEARMRIAASGRGALHEGPDGRFTVVLEADAMPRPAPLGRFVRIHPVEDAHALEAAVRPFARHLSAAALAAAPPARDALARLLIRLGASRVCAPGRLQRPPLGWHRDGLPVLTPLARIADDEG